MRKHNTFSFLASFLSLQVLGALKHVKMLSNVHMIQEQRWRNARFKLYLCSINSNLDLIECD